MASGVRSFLAGRFRCGSRSSSSMPFSSSLGQLPVWRDPARGAIERNRTEERRMPALPATMIAIEITAPGGPEVLRQTTRPTPLPGAGEVLIEVAAAGINRPDVMQRQGAYPPPPGASDIPGLEIAGEVVALGTVATRFKLGDKVTALVAGGGYAQYCPVHETNALPAPANLSLIEAAAIPETFFTA